MDLFNEQHHIIVGTIFSSYLHHLSFSSIFIHKSMTDSSSHFFISVYRADTLDDATHVWCLSLVANHTICHTGINNSILWWQDKASAAPRHTSATLLRFLTFTPCPAAQEKKNTKKQGSLSLFLFPVSSSE